jgi:hypothetical protein
MRSNCLVRKMGRIVPKGLHICKGAKGRVNKLRIGKLGREKLVMQFC